MRAVLIIPNSEARKLCAARNRAWLAWTTDHPASHYGAGVMLYRNGHILDGGNFRILRNDFGVTIETDDPGKVCRALGLPIGEPGISRGR